MYVYSIINHQLTTFKAIQLDQSEQKKSENLLHSLKGCSDLKSDNIKFQLYELYNKHLQKEIDLKTKSYHTKEDFAQEMFLHFFETLEKIRTSILPIENFIQILNDKKPSNNELKSGVVEKSIDINVNNSKLFLKDLLTNDNTPQYKNQKSAEEKIAIEKEFDKLISESTLNDIENKILINIGKGETIKQTAEKLGLSISRINNLYHRAINKIQNDKNILPKEFDDFANELNNKFKFGDSKKIKEILIENPILINKDKDEFFIKIKDLALLLNLSETEIFQILLKTPSLIGFRPDTIKENVKNSADILNISEKEFIEAALSRPQLFYLKSETLKENIKNSAKIFNITEKEFIKAALIQPQLFYQKPETLYENIRNSAVIFDITEKKFIKAALSRPQLFYQKPETLKENIKNSSNLFNITEKEFIKAAIKHPPLFSLKPETLKENVKNSSNLFNISEDEFIKAALRQPQLFSQKPETLYENIKNSSNLFNITEKEFIKVALKQPQLFYQKTETLNNNVSRLAELLNLEKNEILQLGQNSPSMLFSNPENLIKKIRIEKYYKEIKGKKNDKFVLIFDSIDRIYNKILAYLIKTNATDCIVSAKNYVDYVNSHPEKIYEFKLPKSEFNEDFIKFTKDFFMKHTKKCNVKFLIAK